MIDTIEIAKGLRVAGAAKGLADAIAQSILKAHGDDPPVTRTYIDARFSAVDARFSAVDAEFAKVRGEISALRAEMHKGFAGLQRWTVGTVIACTGLGVTLTTFLSRH